MPCPKGLLARFIPNETIVAAPCWTVPCTRLWYILSTSDTVVEWAAGFGIYRGWML